MKSLRYTVDKLLKGMKPVTVYPESLQAHYNRLPDSIEVVWQRDGGMIVGTIVADNFEFATQGEGPAEFIDMVNDAVATSYNIPESYRDEIKKFHTFIPRDEKDLEYLNNQSILSAKYSVTKQAKAFEHA